MQFRTSLAALFMLLAVSALAQTIAVEAVVSPAWVERGSARIPLAAGMPLRDKDRIITGAGSRALLRVAEGSAVKLGENAALAVDDLADKRGSDAARLITASLDVARGAFRFTSEIFGKRQANRDMRIKVATITAGIRGTDVWGKSEAERDVLCLIEGQVAVEHGGQQFTMSDPLSFFIAPRRDKPLPVAPVNQKQLQQWAAETEIQSGSGSSRRGGRYYVDASVSTDQRTALAAYDQLRAAGFPAAVRAAKTGDQVEYRVRISNLSTPQDAAAIAEKLKALGLAAGVSK